jgi:hypothetical protein
MTHKKSNLPEKTCVVCGRPFEVAERFYRRAERDGTLNQVIRNGWAIEDFDDDVIHILGTTRH